MSDPKDFNQICPIPIGQYPQVTLAHGGGGKLMHQLIERMFMPAFSNPLLSARHDGATFSVNGARLAFTTDSYVVSPLFFPGGNIGLLAVNGTVNDLAMCGARPLYLSAGFILEEGLPMETLWSVVKSMRCAADEARLAFESAIESDCAPLGDLVMRLIDSKIEILCMRDLTRGGLASALVEIAEAAKVQIRIDENSIPVREDVRGACEILGFDPLYLANEGRFVAFIAASDADRALDILRSHPLGDGSCLIGKVTNDSSPAVVMRSRIGATRIVDMFSGEQLPRIC